MEYRRNTPVGFHAYDFKVNSHDDDRPVSIPHELGISSVTTIIIIISIKNDEFATPR